MAKSNYIPQYKKCNAKSANLKDWNVNFFSLCRRYSILLKLYTDAAQSIDYGIVETFEICRFADMWKRGGEF